MITVVAAIYAHQKEEFALRNTYVLLSNMVWCKCISCRWLP